MPSAPTPVNARAAGRDERHLYKEGVVDKCPFCGAKFVKAMSSASGLTELFDCHNIFQGGLLYDKRHITCYEREIASNKTELIALREIVRAVADWGFFYESEYMLTEERKRLDKLEGTARQWVEKWDKEGG